MSKPDDKKGGETLPAASQRGKSPKAGKGVGRKAMPPTAVKSVRLPLAMVERHGIDTAWLLDAVMQKIGRYGTEDTDYTQRRINDVLRVLRELEELHANLKQAMEAQL